MAGRVSHLREVLDQDMSRRSRHMTGSSPIPGSLFTTGTSPAQRTLKSEADLLGGPAGVEGAAAPSFEPVRSILTLRVTL